MKRAGGEAFSQARDELKHARTILIKVGTEIVHSPDGLLTMGQVGALVEQIAKTRMAAVESFVAHYFPEDRSAAHAGPPRYSRVQWIGLHREDGAPPSVPAIGLDASAFGRDRGFL